MNVLEFISSLIASLAWPIAILIVIWVLKGPISKLFSSDVRRVKAGPSGVELEFWERQTDAIRESLDEGAGQAVEHETETSWEEVRFAQAAPAGAIIEAYGRVEETLVWMVGVGSQPTSGRRLAETAFKEGLIDRRQLEAIRSLARLRNVAAHPRSDEESPTPEQAIEFIELADWVVSSLSMTSPGPMPEHDLGDF